MHTLVELATTSGGQAHVPAFLAKLWKIVDDPATNDLICWSETGNSFVIRNQAKFSRELLPLYYKHNNMASFVRQLNMYGFHKVVSVESGGLKLDKDEMEFAHPFFLRGNEVSLELIKRKLPAQKEESRVRPESLQRVLSDVRAMRGQQENMDTKLLTMKRENEALWREVSALRQKHSNQTTILSKILQFLVGVMSSRGQQSRLGFKRRLPLMLNEPAEGSGEGIDSEILESGPIPKAPRGGESAEGGLGPVIHDVTGLLDEESCETIPNVESPVAEEILGLANDIGVNDPFSISELTGSPMAATSGANTAGFQGGIPPTSASQQQFPMSRIEMGPQKMITDGKIPKKEDLGSHINSVESGLDNLRDLLTGQEYALDNSTLLGVRPLLQHSTSQDLLNELFSGSTPELNLDNNTRENDNGSQVVSYNPSLFELAEDDHFFSEDNSNLLDSELENMLSTDRHSLAQQKATAATTTTSSFNASPSFTNMFSNTISTVPISLPQATITSGGGLITPTGPSINFPLNPAILTGARKRKHRDNVRDHEEF